jgi:hypothetical protein
LVKLADEEKEEEEVGHSIAISKDVVQVVAEVAVELECFGVLNLKDLHYLLASLGIQVIVNLTPVLDHKGLELIEGLLEASRVRIAIGTFKLVNVVHQGLVILFLLYLLLDFLFSELLLLDFHIDDIL